jgi:streptomycin 6-kinase
MLDTMPEKFAHTMGAEWIGRLPTLIAAIEERWALQIGSPYANQSYHYVAPALRADGSAAVLKLGKPNVEFKRQMEALRLYDGHGAVRPLEADSEIGAMLLERLEPGSMLSSLCETGCDEQATSVAAKIMRELWRPAPPDCDFPAVADWAQGLATLRRYYDGKTGPIPERLVVKAESLFANLLASSTAHLLLHGDLHHFNILSAQREPWLVIDPKGLVGDPGYEIGAFLRNPVLRTRESLSRTIAQLSEELGLDRRRLLDWAFAEGVLSASWHVEDGGQCTDDCIEYCERLDAIKV